MIGTYPGDAQFSEILLRAGCRTNVGEIRALLAGAILGVEMVKPSTVYEHLDFPEGGPSFLEQPDAQVFFQTLSALWNVIADHQAPDSPFSFSATLRELKSVEDWIAFGHQRIFEAELFLLGLELSGTPLRSEIEGYSETEIDSCLPEKIALFAEAMEIEVELFELEKSADISKVQGLIREIDATIKRLYPIFIGDIREWRNGGIEAIAEPITRAEPKIGRNDPCPCGSGRKFKQCCLH